MSSIVLAYHVSEGVLRDLTDKTMADYFNPEVKQSFPDSCAIKSQQLILHDFGIDVSEVDLVQTAAANGWYNGGTAPEDVGNLLELANIPITRQENANIFNLVNELAQGHKVIVGLDADEMWYNDSISDKLKNWYNDFLGESGGNHALIVAGIDTSDPNNIQVIVKDPGSGDDGKPYPLDQFMDAWSDANCYMVSTAVAVPSVVQGMENFDYATGHIQNVAGLDYSEFQIFNDISNGLPPYVPKEFDINGNQLYNMPVSSLMDSYFDVAQNNIPFNHIFSPEYDFNAYLDFNAVNASMCNTLAQGFNTMPMDNDRFWNNYAMYNDISFITNDDYANFLTNSIGMYDPMSNIQSIDFCNQQMMMLDYCNCNKLDFGNEIYNPCIDLFYGV